MSIIPYTNNLRQSCTHTQPNSFSTATVSQGNYEFWYSLTADMDVKISECDCSQMVTEINGDIPTHLNYNSIETVVNNYVNKYRRNITIDFIPYFLNTSTLDFETKQEVAKYLEQYI